MPLVAAVGMALVVAFLIWFALGTQRNISRGNELLRWLQGGLPRLGHRTSLRWFGSSAAQLEIVDAKAPFATVQVNVVLEPRDIGWLWAWARRQGRRDFLILRATLPEPPRVEIEAGGRRGWTGSERLERLDPAAWQRTRWEDGNGVVEVAHSLRTSEDDVEAIHEVWSQLAESGAGVWRLSVRRKLSSHLEVHVEAPSVDDAEGADSDQLVLAFHELGRLATRP
jgi:hypothetical protein